MGDGGGARRRRRGRTRTRVGGWRGQLAPPVRAQPLVVPARSRRRASASTSARAREANTVRVPRGTDLVEWYFEQGWTDGLPVVPPTPEAVDAAVAALGGDPHFVACR